MGDMRRLYAALLVAAVLVPQAALAHSGTKQGTTTLTVGWATEPALVGQPNRVEVLAVHDGAPRTDATLTVEVLFGGKDAERRTDPLALDPITGRPGWYEAAIIPTAAGIYSLHVAGKVSEDKVNIFVTSGPNTFDSVIEPTELQFPAELPTVTEIAGAATGATDDAAAARAAAKDAKDDAAMARLLGALGIVLGLVATGLAIRASKVRDSASA